MSNETITDPYMIFEASDSETYNSSYSKSNVFIRKGVERPNVSPNIPAISEKHLAHGGVANFNQTTLSMFASGFMNTPNNGSSKDVKSRTYRDVPQGHVTAYMRSSMLYSCPMPGRFTISDFKLGKVLGYGGTATVIRAKLISSSTKSTDSKQYASSQQEMISKTAKRSDVVCVQQMRPEEKCQHVNLDDAVEYEKGFWLLETTSNLIHNSRPECQGTYALKVVSKKYLTKRAMHYLRREVTIHRAVQHHKSIVSLFDVFEDKHSVYLLEELIRGGDLFKALKNHGGGISELCALRIVDQILGALSFMHRHGFVHRDIKPENIMFSKAPNFSDPSGSGVSEVKIIDFGLSCARDPSLPTQMRTSSERCGTLRYAAPEVLTEGRYIPELADVWSVGVVFYSSIAYKNPYNGDTGKAVLEQIEMSEAGKPNFNSKEWDHVSKHSKSIIEHMLRKSPTDRPSAQKAQAMVQNAINHQLQLYHLCSRRRNREVTEPKKKDRSFTEEAGMLRKNDSSKSCQSSESQNVLNTILSFFNGHVS